MGLRVVSHLHLLSAGQRASATQAHTIGSAGGSSGSRSGGSSQVRPDIRRKRSKVHGRVRRHFRRLGFMP